MRRARWAAVIAAAAGVAMLLRRRSGRQRIDLYFEDGSMISLGPDSPEARRLLGIAGDALATARR